MRSTTTKFFFIKIVDFRASGSIGICIKKGEKVYIFVFLSAKGAEEGGGGLLSPLRSRTKTSELYEYVFFLQNNPIM